MKNIDLIPINLSRNDFPTFKVARNNDWIKYGSNNLFPNDLVDYYNSSNTHSSIIKQKAELVLGQGLQVNEENQDLVDFFENISDELDINDLIYKMGLDILLFNCISTQAQWSRDGEIVAKINLPVL